MSNVEPDNTTSKVCTVGHVNSNPNVQTDSATAIYISEEIVESTEEKAK